MKIAEYMEKNINALPEKLADILLQSTSIWSNDACYGYIIVAMENAGYPREEIIKMFNYLHSAFEEYTVEEAEKKWVEY